MFHQIIMNRTKHTYQKNVYDFITDIYMLYVQNVAVRLLSKHRDILLKKILKIMSNSFAQTVVIIKYSEMLRCQASLQ